MRDSFKSHTKQKGERRLINISSKHRCWIVEILVHKEVNKKELIKAN